MTPQFGALCDEFFLSTRLYLKLGLAPDRETVLHFFDRIRREYPTMRKMRRRDDGTVILEEDERDGDCYKWLRLDAACLRIGYSSPPSVGAYRRYVRFLLDQAPYHLTISDLDVDYIEVMFGFDMEYRGNHDQLVADTLYADHPLASLAIGDDAAHAIDCQPYFGVALTPNCDTQACVEIKSRTSTYEMRTGDFEPQMLSVFLAVRKYWGFGDSRALGEVHDSLCEKAEQMAGSKVVPLVVNPLAQAIASRR
jgi:hypothetical protein